MQERLGPAGIGVVEAHDAIAVRDGTVAGEYWYTINMCRFEPEELDDYIEEIRRLPDDHPLLEPA